MRTAHWFLPGLIACAGAMEPKSDPPDASTLPAAAEAMVVGPLVVEVGAVLAVSPGEGSAGVAFRWDFGDGTLLEGESVEHIYEQPGNYTLVLEATGEDGSTQTAATAVTAHLRPLNPLPSAASGLQLDADGSLWVAEPDAGTITHIAATGMILDRFTPCDRPLSLVLRTEELVVSCREGRIVGIVDAEPVWTEDLGPRSLPRGIVDSAGGLLVALSGADTVLELASGTEHLAPDAWTLAVSESTWWAPRFRSLDDLGLITSPEEDLHLAYDLGPDSDTSIRGVPNLLGHALLSPDGGTLYVSGTIANTSRGAFRDGEPLTHETTAHAVVIALDLATGEERWRKQFDDHGVAGAMALSPLGNTLYVAHPGNQSLSVLDAYDSDQVASISDLGGNTLGLVATEDTLFVHSEMQRTVRSFDVSALAAPREVWGASTIESEPLPPDVLLGKLIFHDSANLAMARDGYLSCATCHPDGDHDGIVWDFTDRGEGLRNTTSLWGRADMGRLHWTANFDEVQDFEHDMRSAFGGTGFLDDADFLAAGGPLGSPLNGLSPELDALAAYVMSLQVPQSEDGDATLFDASGCADCHPAPFYTDSQWDPDSPRHDVGTLSAGSGERLSGSLDGLDTPSLLGTRFSAPWLHDGSATTLTEAIEAHTEVSSAEAEELTAFVRKL